MLTVISMFSPCTQWVFGPLSPVTGDTVNVPGISWTRETAKKLAWKILNVLPVPRSVYGGYFVHVLAVYLQCTSPVHHPLPPVGGMAAKSGG